MYVPSPFWKPSSLAQSKAGDDNLETLFAVGWDSLVAGLLKQATWLYDQGSTLEHQPYGEKIKLMEVM